MEGRDFPRAAHSLVKALRSVPSLELCDEQSLLTIVGDSANLFWQDGSMVFERGTPSDGLYIVLAGAVRIRDEAGRDLTTLGAGEYFGEFSLLLGTAHQHDVLAVEDTELMVVPKERFDALVAENPELGRRIREKAEARLAANRELAEQDT
jgi:CRP/FNR family cyclic AMP-dependent transcriptional regulator